MKKFTWNRMIFDLGLNILKILLFVVVLSIFIKFTISEYLGVIFNQEITIILGMSLALIILIYEFISNITSRLVNKIHYNLDRNEAIEILEKNKLSVGLLLTDLPKDAENNELRDCIDAYQTLKNQNLTFVLINSHNVCTSRLYFLGQRGKNDYNKYKLIIKRSLD